MATTALGIMQTSDGSGVDPVTHRRIIKARWSNTGVISGLDVTGGSGLTYGVSAGNAVLSRSDTDGYVEAYWEGGQTPAVSAGDPSNPRIDTIWIKANDAQQGDPDNRVHVGVEEGVAAPSPVAPAAPSGCLALASMMVPAGATSTSSAERTDDSGYAIPYGSSLGLLGYAQDTRDWIKKNDDSYTYAVPVQFTVPTDRLVELDARLCIGACKEDGSLGGDWLNYSIMTLYVQLDGKTVDGGGMQVTCFRSNTIYQMRPIVTASAGTHTARIAFRFSPEGNPAHVVYSPTLEKFPGLVMRVWDRGVAQ